MKKVVCVFFALFVCAGCASTPTSRHDKAVGSEASIPSSGSSAPGAFETITLMLGDHEMTPAQAQKIKEFTKGKIVAWESDRVVKELYLGFFSFIHRDEKRKFVTESVRSHSKKDFGTASDDQKKRAIGTYTSENFGMSIVIFMDGDKRRIFLNEEYNAISERPAGSTH